MWPWSVLGIEPGSDERAIKKAYARKLKDCRPDDDPEGFAELVKARDFAIRINKDSMSAFEDSDNNTYQEASETGNQHDPESQFRNITFDLYDKDNGEEQQAPQKQFADLSGHRSQDFKDEPALLARMQQYLGEIEQTPPSLWTYDNWPHIIKLISQLDFRDRQSVQVALLRLYDMHLYQKQRCLTSAEYESFLKIILLLDQEFKWSEGDHVVYNILGFDEADHFMKCLRKGLADLPAVRKDMVFALSKSDPSDQKQFQSYHQQTSGSKANYWLWFIIILVLIKLFAALASGQQSRNINPFDKNSSHESLTDKINRIGTPNVTPYEACRSRMIEVWKSHITEEIIEMKCGNKNKPENLLLDKGGKE